MQVQNLVDTVIDGGYCIGCGACATLDRSPFKIRMNENLQYQAYLDEPNGDFDVPVEKVCPFSDKSLNEDEIADNLYSSVATKHDKLGHVLSTYAGYVSEDLFREEGSSGGMGTWILAELLRLELVDAVLHIKEKKDNNDNIIFEYTESRDLSEVLKGAKSRYYPIELSKVVKLIKDKPGRYAIVGLPCFIKSLRLLTNIDSILHERVKFCVGLVCGHIKSARFASMWAWQIGIHPNDLQSINFRAKLPNYGANQYGVTVKGLIDSKEVIRTSPPLGQMYGSNWGWGLFKHKACDYCDDVVAETADITIGDAWLPQYLSDSQGTNVLVIRNPIIHEIIVNARKLGRLSLEDVTPADVVKSQSAGFNHRRDALAYRLYLTDKKKIWRPKKRVDASMNTITDKSKAIQRLRIKLAEKSHEAFRMALKDNSFETFKTELAPLVKEYRLLYLPPLFTRVFNRLKKIFKIN
jgi:coenzyme F420 hydrogenase subunit beta